MIDKGAVHTLVEVLAYYKHQATDFEAMMWNRIIEQHGDGAVIAFLQAHVMRSQYAPKVNEALAMLQPGANNAAAAFMALTDGVARCGPYKAPAFEDPALVDAVVRMGGWAAVNEQMPSPQVRFDYEAYFKRFETAYQMACADLALRRPLHTQLLGLHDITRERLALATPGAERMQELLTTGSSPAMSPAVLVERQRS